MKNFLKTYLYSGGSGAFALLWIVACLVFLFIIFLKG